MRLYRTALTPEDAAVLAEPDADHRDRRRCRHRKRTAAQADKIRSAFLDRYAPEEMQAARKDRARSRGARRNSSWPVFPTVMVMQESATPRETHVLIRGAYDRPGDKVTPGVPAVAAAAARGCCRTIAWDWLDGWSIRPIPCTARVAVNRFWQMYFGTGLVKTVEDFGSQGEWPSHPDLLDWLATEFIRTGWDVKAIQKTIVMSATYRQSSAVTPALMQKDPENRLLARGPRVRLAAETVRDQALVSPGFW